MDANFELESNHTIGEEENQDWSTFYIVFFEICTVSIILAVLVDLLIVFTILKYRRLRQDIGHIIVLHWHIINAFNLVLFAISVQFTLYDIWNIKHLMMLCVLADIENTCISNNILLVALLTFYWYIKTYHPTVAIKFTRHFYFFLMCVHIVCLFAMGLYMDTCINHRKFHFSGLFLVGAYMAYVLYMLVINVMHAIRKRIRPNVNSNKSDNIFLWLANTFLLSSLQYSIARWCSSSEEPAFNYEFVSIVLNLLNPVCNLCILYRYHNDFNSFIKHIFSGRCFSYRNDEFVTENAVVFEHDERENS